MYGIINHMEYFVRDVAKIYWLNCISVCCVRDTICALSAILNGSIKIMINLYVRKVRNLIGVSVREVSIISINLMQIWNI
jgi:hypothetical protein